MYFALPCYLLITPCYLVITSAYSVVTSGYLIATTGYFSLLLVPHFNNNAESITDSKRFLKSLRTSNPDKLVFTHLNINSIRNKFEMLLDQIKANIDILMV